MLVHYRPLFHRNDGLWRWRAVAQSTVWPFCIVVLPPLFDQNLRFLGAVEYIKVQEFISKASIEALAISLFPR